MAAARALPAGGGGGNLRRARGDIRRFAEWYQTISPAAISVGNGLERNQNGGSGIRAIFALPALAGKFGVPGGGLVNGAGYAFPKTPQRLQRPDLVPPGTRTLNIVDVGAHLLDPTCPRRSRPSSSTTTTRSSCIPTRTACAAASPARTSSWWARDVAMTDSLAYATSSCPRAATSSTTTSSRPTARTGCSAPSP